MSTENIIPAERGDDQAIARAVSESGAPDATEGALISAPQIGIAHAIRVLEAAILTSKDPLPLEPLARLFDPALPTDTVRNLLETLKSQWQGRGVELAQVATGYRFQAKTEMQGFLDRMEPDKAPRYSRSVMETLAIIAYRQPTTRGEIEAIRGVAVSSHVIKALEDREWIEVIGHKESPGRPSLYATTKKFLNDLSLRSLSELPALADLDEHPALDVPEVPAEPPFPKQARLDTERDDGQTILEMPIADDRAVAIPAAQIVALEKLEIQQNQEINADGKHADSEPPTRT